MKPLIKISESVIKRLSKAKEPCFGKLAGTCSQNTFVVLGLHVDNETDLFNSYPGEVYCCGVFQINDDGTFDEDRVLQSVHVVDVTDSPIFISCKLGAPNEIVVRIVSNDHIEELEYLTVSEQDIYSQFVHIRLKGEIPLKCEVSLESIQEAFQKVIKTVSSGEVVFTIPKTNVFLFGGANEDSTVGIDSERKVVDMLEESNETVEGIQKKKKTQSFKLDILDINILKRVTRNTEDSATNQHAPLCILEKKAAKALDTMLCIDFLSVIYREGKVANLYEILIETTVRYLKLYESSLMSYFVTYVSDIAYIAEVSRLETFHFYPTECGHFLTLLYPTSETENSLKKQRELLHKQLLLDVVTPMFRRGNRYKFKIENPNSGPLLNPHEGVKPTDNGGTIALVKGKYEYYHYCQNKMDDNGWGCAYRSLQTLASWYKLQGYVDREVPSYKEIQKCLVDIGDKPASFIDSRQWIGSTEVNFVLNTLLGITCKILYVSSGEDMAMKGPELVNHFLNQGSPIMIGGGVLAHTILGVDYNQQTGDIRFLILDPHYTGGEDLHVIQNKGWCGWKTVDFWDKSAYYNMCLPQVPRGV
ncbi:hypothetical protein NQ315_007696 [Exocentrus adspersus]|uniref:Probable Ufm1-specific protease 2 n=1 Tax=Exocentrus adspersus TaxID=1586481 RepID=A0AAV8W8G5_9CUCU|nr:hypothetical protein NQ315_007696 [Exocentrus adspersus]